MTPQQLKTMKLALDLATMHHTDDGYAELRAKVRSASKEALAQPEQEPVAWLLTHKNINSIQVDSIQRLIDRLKHAHHTDIRVRINGHDEWFEADWLKHMVRVIPSQPEQNPMSDEMLQAITDPENQPSQYGTVTLDYHFEKIKKWEDLFERMSNKVLQQPEQEPVAWADLNALSEQINSVNCGTVYRLPSEEENRQPLYTHPPQRTEQEPCVHAKNPKGCYRVRCQLGDKCVDDEMSFRTTTPQPERHELQAKGEHPAPCARHCEANAFQIVIKNLKAQLAQPEQEPVAWYDKHGMATHDPFEGVTPLYTTPPQRTWVGLTDEERSYCVETPFVSQQWANIEAKLKQKNT